MKINNNRNVKEMQETLMLIGKDNYDVMNTMKGILVISPSELNFDLNVNQNE